MGKRELIMKINKSLLLKIMNIMKTISVWGLAGVGCLTIFSLLFIINEWLAIFFPYLICFSIFAAERIKRYTTLKHKVCCFWKYITVLVGCCSIACVIYCLISTSTEDKEASVEISPSNVTSPQLEKNKENFDTLVKSTIEQAANAGNDDARFLLGQCYEYGLLNTPQNMQTALAYYRSSNSRAARNALDRHKLANIQEMNDVTLQFDRMTSTLVILNFMEEIGEIIELKDGSLALKSKKKTISSIVGKGDRWYFVEEVWADKKNNKMRLTLSMAEYPIWYWRTMLLDLKGDGDFRYLIIGNCHTRSASDGMKGYVIDVKDNFKHIATIPVGEAFDLPYTNPKMIFNGEK